MSAGIIHPHRALFPALALILMSAACWSRPAIPPGAVPLTTSEGEPATGSPAIVQAPGELSLRDTLVIMVYMLADEGIDSQKHYIEPLPPQPEITVTSPNAGAAWPLGSTRHIRWTARAVEQVYIELSYDNGRTYEKRIVEAGKTINHGDSGWLDYVWTVEGATGDNCVIRVSEYENKAYGIAGPFSIVERSGAAARRRAPQQTTPRITFPADSGERLLPRDAYMFRGTGARLAWYYRVVDTLGDETAVRFTRRARRQTTFSTAGRPLDTGAQNYVTVFTLSGRRLRRRRCDLSAAVFSECARSGAKSGGLRGIVLTRESKPIYLGTGITN